MDALSALLEGPRASGAFALRGRMEPPWGIGLEDESPLALIVMVTGDAYVVDDGVAVRLGPGEVAVVTGTAHYRLGSDPDAEPTVVVHPGQRTSVADGSGPDESRVFGTRTWGNDPNGSVTMLFGVYEEVGTVGRRLLAALPRCLTMTENDWDTALLDVLGREMDREAPGQSVVLDRLLDLLLVSVVRAWFDRPEAHAPSWYRAASDPVVGGALRLLHDAPAHPWTVADLAAAVGVSRAALARSFSHLVDVPPMTYLTEWRLALAADLLRTPDLTLDAVARRVGYSNGFALSTAFKRLYGVSPAQHRSAS